MARRRFEFAMPAREDVVFDAFHYRYLRPRWDLLVRATRVQGDAPCPSVGAESNRSWLINFQKRAGVIEQWQPERGA